MLAELSCRNPGCTDYGLEGEGNVVKYGKFLARTVGKRQQRFRCRTCGHTFSDRTGSVFCGLRASDRTVARVCDLVARGVLTEHQLAKKRKVTPKTIRHWLRRLAECPEEVGEFLKTQHTVSPAYVVWALRKLRAQGKNQSEARRGPTVRGRRGKPRSRKRVSMRDVVSQ